MTNDSGRLGKRFRSVFLLDPSKLRRLLAVIEAKFADAGDYEQNFHVTLQSGKDLAVRSVDHILEHDNAVRNPINELSIQVAASDGTSDALVPFDREDNEIDVRINSCKC